MMKNNLNPDFEKSFILSYYFERHQYIKFEIIDGDNALGGHDMIGSAETTVGTILGSKQQTFMSDLSMQGSSKSRGKLIVRADAVKESNMDVRMKLGARNLPSTGNCLCSNNNILFEIYRSSPAGN